VSFERRRAEVKVGQADPSDPRVDVIVTTFGGEQTARAVKAGGGIVGLRSSANPPNASIGFVDWPFQLEDASVGKHIDAVRELRPKYAVAPDVEDGRTLGEVLDTAEVLRQSADHVIVVPKTVDVDEVPNQYVVGVPFRNEWDTDTGVNSYRDFTQRPVHILGGNPTQQFKLVDFHDYEVASVDSPNPLAWADAGRVWVARLGGADGVKSLLLSELKERTSDPKRIERKVERLADEAGSGPSSYIRQLSVEEFIETFDVEFLLNESAIVGQALGVPSYRELLQSRFHRIKYTLMNLREAWVDRQVTRVRPVSGRGPAPPAPEGLVEENIRQKRMERFLDTAVTEDVGEVEEPEPRNTELDEWGS